MVRQSLVLSTQSFPLSPQSFTLSPKNRVLFCLMRLAYFSPLPPAHTGIADYSAELLPHLGQLVDLTLFHANPEAVAPEIRAGWRVEPMSRYEGSRPQFNLALYQMGNSTHHTDLYRMALRYPGVVVLHDLVLHHFIEATTRRQGDEAGYMQAVGHALGQQAGGLRRYLQLRGSPTAYTLPLNNLLVDRSLMVLVHSHYAQKQLQTQGTRCPIAVIPQPMAHYPAAAPSQHPNWPDECVVFAALGQVTAAKQVELALRAFARLHESHRETRFLLVGEVMREEVDVPGIVARYGLQEAVIVTGFVAALRDFVNWISLADVVVNLRYPTQGETSATALRGMAQGKPVIVFDHGWYSELPDAAAIKLPPLDEEALYQTMLRLTESVNMREEMGNAAAHYIQTHHRPAVVAGEIYRLLTDYLHNVFRPT